MSIEAVAAPSGQLPKRREAAEQATATLAPGPGAARPERHPAHGENTRHVAGIGDTLDRRRQDANHDPAETGHEGLCIGGKGGGDVESKGCHVRLHRSN